MGDAILRLKSLSFEGAGLYRQPVLNLPLEKKGKVLICGEEGSGKSIIPEVLTLILYGKGSPRLRKTGFVESSIVNLDVGYKGDLSFQSGSGASERDVSITQAFRHKRLKSRYVITVDGVREEPTTKPEQKKLVKRLAPLSYDEWLGVAYLPQGGIHDLLAGTPTEKRQYLTSVFGLDFYDDLVEEAKLLLKDLIDKSKNAIGVKQRLVDLEHEITEIEAVVSELPTTQEIDETVERQQRRLQDQSRELGQLEAMQDTVEELREASAELGEILRREGWAHASEAREAEINSSERISSLTTKLADVNSQLREVKSQASSYEEVKKKLAGLEALTLGISSDMKELEKTLNRFPSEESLQGAAKLLLSAKEFGFKLRGTDAVSGDWKELANQASSSRKQAANLETLLNEHEHVTEAECPTCAQELDLKLLKRTVDMLTGEAKVYKKSAAEALSASLQEHVGDLALPLEVDDCLIVIKRVLRDFQAYNVLKDKLIQTTQRTEETEKFLALLPKPKDPAQLEQKKLKLEKSLEEEKVVQRGARQASNASVKIKALEKTLGDIDVDGLQPALVSLKAKREKTQASYEEAVSLKERSTQTRSELRALNKQRNQLEVEITQHAGIALRIQSYDSTLVPYFTALRAAKVRSCVSVLESVLPVYVRTMAESQYEGAEVRLTISDDLKDVDMELCAGKNRKWISALQASGGQRRRFTLAIIAALREVSPRKANIMFFDEPFADLQAEGKLLFINRLVPTLMERCPDLESLFLIAHDAEILQAGNDTFDDVWQVSTDDTGSSQVLTGQKLSMIVGK